MKRIALLGSTGSVGTQTLDVVRRLPDRLKIVALAAGSSVELLARQAAEFGARAAAISDESRGGDLKRALSGRSIVALSGDDAMTKLATRLDVDIVVVAVAGSVGTRATVAALEAGKDVALATKEILVAAGGPVCGAARVGAARILPIDSEHSAVFQCTRGERAENIAKLWLTASGGPFRELNHEQLSHVTPKAALNHPTWNMGPKITVDSATMMNKGLEMIEATWLFGLPIDRIGVVVHPQSIVHSIVEMVDGSLLAQLGLPDMRLPIEYALLYPERADLGRDFPRLDPRQMGQLTFELPDENRFPCLALARRAAETAGTMPAVLNAANESAVGLFLEGKLPFTAIAGVIGAAMDAHAAQWSAEPSLDDALEADRWARRFTADHNLVCKQ